MKITYDCDHDQAATSIVAFLPVIDASYKSGWKPSDWSGNEEWLERVEIIVKAMRCEADRIEGMVKQAREYHEEGLYGKEKGQ